MKPTERQTGCYSGAVTQTDTPQGEKQRNVLHLLPNLQRTVDLECEIFLSELGNMAVNTTQMGTEQAK